MAKEKLFHVGVKALITNSAGEILIFEVDTSKFLTPDPAHADLPGGRIDRGEDPLEALKREMAEETGITTYSDVQLFTAVVSPMLIPVSKTEKVGLALFIYTLKVADNTEVVMSDEHVSYEWVTPQVAAERLEFKFGKDFADTLLRASAA
jgi:8-oxo-dGTP diphosphatase